MTPPGGICYSSLVKSFPQRLNNIIGQLEGVKKMIDSDKDCLQVLIQLKAAKSALSSLINTMVDEQFDTCLKSLKNEDKKLLIKIKHYVQPN